MEPDDLTPLSTMTHMNLTHEQAAPIYGVIAHYYLGRKYSPSMTFVLQALAAIEATASISEDGHGFFATMGDIVQHANLDMSTVDRVLTELEKAEVLARHRRPFKPSIFWITWENTLLGNEGAAYLHAAQNSIWDN
nr:MAG TPA: FaeA-like protein [Caudoviricetes sp.]